MVKISHLIPKTDENFLSVSSIHGIRYISNDRAKFERLVWLVIVFLGFFFGSVMISNAVDVRFQIGPTYELFLYFNNSYIVICKSFIKAGTHSVFNVYNVINEVLCGQNILILK